MTISGISSNDNNYLASLLNAQQSVSQIQQNNPFDQILQNNQNISQTPSQQKNGQISSVTNQDLQNLASALQTGDLSGAKQAYAQLTQDLQSSGQTQGHHHHHHHHKASGTSQSDTANQAIRAAGSVGNTSSTKGQTSLLA